MLKDQTIQRRMTTKTVESDDSLYIEYDADNRATQAVVKVMKVPTNKPLPATYTVIPAVSSMPYIRLPKGSRPTHSATVELHKLSVEQEFSFRLIMEPLQKHLDGETDIPQLTMSVVGNAGEWSMLFRFL